MVMLQAGAVASAALNALRQELSDGALITDLEVMERYRYDSAPTVIPGQPLVVVRAAHREDVQATLRVASRFRVPVVARGAGTGLSGGASAIDGAITLSTERLRWISIDAAAMTATVGPGILNAEVKAAAANEGLWYPPDPSSFETSSIGGNLATNAGGLCCLKYGVTSDYVLGLEVVLADGLAVRLGGHTMKDVAGYDLKRLVVGSEGTLGVITEAILRLLPAQRPRTTVVGIFDTVVDAGRAVSAIMAQMRPAVLELMDGSAVMAVQTARPMGLEEAGALLIGQCDAGLAESETMAKAYERCGASYVAVTDDIDEGELFMGARRMALPCVERLGSVMIEDVCVPIPRFPELVAAVEAIAARHDTLIPVVGHAGDGNIHPLVTFDAGLAGSVSRAADAFQDIMVTALAMGGTVSGEHGIGTLKAAHLESQIGSSVLELTRRVKAAFDPYGILNPGKWV